MLNIKFVSFLTMILMLSILLTSCLLDSIKIQGEQGIQSIPGQNGICISIIEFNSIILSCFKNKKRGAASNAKFKAFETAPFLTSANCNIQNKNVHPSSLFVSTSFRLCRTQ